MKRMMNKLAALIITLSMVICSVLGCGVQNVSAKVESGYGAETTYADIGDIADETEEDNEEDDEDEEDEDAEKDISVDDMLDIEYHITAKWEKHCNVDMTIKNISGNYIDNWEVCFDLDAEIENIWNAQITSHEDGEYTIKNAGWNQDIGVDNTVTFGMTIKYDGDFEFPTDCYLTREQIEVQKDYSIKYKENSHWDGHVNGRIIVTNDSEENIEDWKLDIKLDGVKSIDNIWNAKVLLSEGGVFKLNNANYNQNIAPGESVEFGFIAKCSDTVGLSGYTLYEMSDDVRYFEGNYVEEDFDEENYEVYYDSEDFDTYEEYLQYLQENGLEQPTLFSRRTKAAKKQLKSRDALINTYFKFFDKNGHVIEDAGKVKATQSYQLSGMEAYTIYAGTKKDKGNAYLTLGKTSYVGYDFKQSDSIKMKGFAHGQTNEILEFGKGKKKQKYFMFGGKSDGKKWAKEIAFIKFGKVIDKLKDKKELAYDINKTNLVRRITHINCANKKGDSKGVVKRVDAALSADMSVLAIWCMFMDGAVQVSLYKMGPIREFVKKTKKMPTFSLKSSKAKKACLASYYQKPQKGKRSLGDCAVHPSNSFQSIEVSNKVGSNKHYVYICGGNENTPNQNGLQISRFTMTENKSSISNRRRVMVNPKTQGDDKNDIESHNREIEGCHIVGKDLQFLITHSKTNGEQVMKNLQYICRIKKNEFTSDTKY